jgi:drug/metabolite transporter (DMT)-like permease
MVVAKTMMSGKPGGETKSNHRLVGMACVAMSSFLFSLMLLQIKALTRGGMPSFQIVFVRSILNGALNIAQLLCTGGHFKDLLGKPGSRCELFIRFLTGALAFTGGFWAIELISLPDATVLRFTAPLWAGLFAYCVLKEPWSLLFDGGGCMVALAGVVLVARPSFLFPENNASGGPSAVGVGVALFSAMGAGYAFVCIRKLGAMGVR